MIFTQFLKTFHFKNEKRNKFKLLLGTKNVYSIFDFLQDNDYLPNKSEKLKIISVLSESIKTIKDFSDVYSNFICSKEYLVISYLENLYSLNEKYENSSQDYWSQKYLNYSNLCVMCILSHCVRDF